MDQPNHYALPVPVCTNIITKTNHHHPDDVEVTGVVMRFFKDGRLKLGAMTDVPLFVCANNLTVVRQADKGSIEVDEDSVAEFRRFWEHHQHCPLQVGATGCGRIWSSACSSMQSHILYLVLHECIIHDPA